MEFSSHRTQSNYPVWLGVILFSLGLFVWAQHDESPPEGSTTASPEKGTVQKLADAETVPDRTPSVVWEIIGSKIPEKPRLRRCLEKQGFDSTIALIGSPSTGLTIMHSRLAIPISVIPEGHQITLKTHIGRDLFSETRFHVGIAYCLYAEHGRVFDPLLKRAYEHSAWPALGPEGSAPISFFINISVANATNATEGSNSRRWRTHGMSRLGRPELAFDAPQTDPGDRRARRLLLVTAARVAGAPQGTTSVTLKGIGRLRLTASNHAVAEQNSDGDTMFFIEREDGQPIRFSASNPTPGEPKLSDQSDKHIRQPPRPRRTNKARRRPKAESGESNGFKPDYR